MIKEIGSEFSNSQFKSNKDTELNLKLDNYICCFSGRTAIDLVIKDAKIKKVAMPSYCCESMIEPFIRNGVEVSFYTVRYEKKIIKEFKIPNACDAVFLCNYFGYREEYPNELYRFKSQGGIVIEDITHSLLSKTHFEEADYYVASIRKWDGFVSGGIIIKVNGTISAVLDAPNEKFLSIKKEAMELKEQYLNDLDTKKKEAYLSLFKESNAYFASNYENIAIDEFSLSMFKQWDTKSIIEKRIKNANILHKELKNSNVLAPMLSQNDLECPLFVPVIAKNKETRDAIRKKLIDCLIYCPVHWNISTYGNESNVYDREISLVCDQRYNESDMERILSVIKEF